VPLSSFLNDLSCLNDASRTKARCTKWPRTIIEPLCLFMYRALTIWCVKNYFLTVKRWFFFYLIAMKMNRQILSLEETLVYVLLEKLCLFWSIQFYCEGKWNRKLITVNNNNGNFICVFESTIVNLVTYRQFTNAAWDWIIKRKEKQKQNKSQKNKKKKIQNCIKSGISQVLFLQQKM